MWSLSNFESPENPRSIWNRSSGLNLWKWRIIKTVPTIYTINFNLKGYYWACKFLNSPEKKYKMSLVGYLNVGMTNTVIILSSTLKPDEFKWCLSKWGELTYSVKNKNGQVKLICQLLEVSSYKPECQNFLL